MTSSLKSQIVENSILEAVKHYWNRTQWSESLVAKNLQVANNRLNWGALLSRPEIVRSVTYFIARYMAKNGFDPLLELIGEGIIFPKKDQM